MNTPTPNATRIRRRSTKSQGTNRPHCIVCMQEIKPDEPKIMTTSRDSAYSVLQHVACTKPIKPQA